jgi:hypothetical protein
MFIFGGLLMGGLLKVFSRFAHVKLSNNIQVPYNPLLIGAGLAMGFYHENLSLVGRSSLLVSEMNPNGIIAIFLPALLFESAFVT